jgi:hypothetical protein
VVNAGNGPNESEFPIDWSRLDLSQAGGLGRPEELVASKSTYQLQALSKIRETLSVTNNHELLLELDEVFHPNSTNCFETRNWRSSDILTLLKSIYTAGASNIGSEQVSSLWALRDRDGESCFHYTVRTESFFEKSLEIIQFGADLNSRSKMKPHEIAIRKEISFVEFNALEVALCSGRFGLAGKLISAGQALNRQYSENESRTLTADIGDQLNGLITSHRWADLDWSLEILRKIDEPRSRYIIEGAVNWHPIEHDISLIVLALVNGCPRENVDKLLRLGARATTDQQSRQKIRYEFFDSQRDTEYTDEVGLIKEISAISSDARIRYEYKKDIANEAKNLFLQKYNLQHLYWYYDLYRDSCFIFPPGDCKSGARLAGPLQLEYPGHQIDSLLSAIESYNDHWYGNSSGSMRNRPVRHPFFREMALLLYHPTKEGFHRDEVDSLTLAITSQEQWVRKRVSVHRGTVFNWMRLGKHTHDFRSYKWDTAHPKQTSNQDPSTNLLQAFGAKKIEGRGTDDNFVNGEYKGPRLGKGYLLKGSDAPFKFNYHDARFNPKTIIVDPDLEIEFRRSYIRVFNPRDGLLLITNSSPEFGRNCFKSPFYWLPPDELWNLQSNAQLSLTEAEVESRMYPVDNRKINMMSGTTEHIGNLLDQLAAIRERYRLWKFNNDQDSAWDRDQKIPEYQLLGGHRSNGFKNIINHISALSRSSPEFQFFGTPIVDLGFCDTRMPPWSPLAFKEIGSLRGRLRITPEILRALENIVSATSPEYEYEEDMRVGDIREFLAFGLEHHSNTELIILDALKI